MPPEKLLSMRIVQIDIILCWIGYIARAMALPAVIAVFLWLEGKLAKSIRKDKSKWKLNRMRKD